MSAPSPPYHSRNRWAYQDSLSNGLTVVAEKFKNEYIAGHVQLKKGERSYLSAVAAKILWVKHGQNIYICPLASYDMISYIAVPNNILSYDIICYHMLWYQKIWCPVISWPILWYHMLLIFQNFDGDERWERWMLHSNLEDAISIFKEMRWHINNTIMINIDSYNTTVAIWHQGLTWVPWTD